MNINLSDSEKLQKFDKLMKKDLYISNDFRCDICMNDQLVLKLDCRHLLCINCLFYHGNMDTVVKNCSTCKREIIIYPTTKFDNIIYQLIKIYKNENRSKIYDFSVELFQTLYSEKEMKIEILKSCGIYKNINNTTSFTNQTIDEIKKWSCKDQMELQKFLNN